MSVTARPLKGEEDVLLGGVVVFSDITERKRAEDVLAKERNLLCTLIDHLPEYIFVKDTQCRYMLVNRALMSAQGTSSVEAVAGKTDLDYFPRQLAERYRADDQAVLQSGQALVDREEPVVDHEGKTAWVSTTKVPFRDGRGTIIGLVGICHDVTERKRAEQEIQQLNDDLRRRAIELETVNKELEAFSYSVSHDLRAPLRHIDGFAELLLKHTGDKLDDKSRRYVKTISQSAKEMGQLISDLLVFSRMGRSEMRHTSVHLEHLTREVIGELAAATQGRNINWRIGPLSAVQADPPMLRLVLVNLLSNAVKYTRTRSEAEIEIGCHAKSDEEVFFVRDNGIGFDMRYVDKLFGVFQRLHDADAFEGTGIGLANVRRIIHRHGGRTWAEGAVDTGATFYFSLPTNGQGA